MVATQYAFAGLKEGFGLAEGGVGLGPGVGSISGVDPRTDRIYVNSLALGCSGGPGTPVCDGWLTYAAPCGAGLTYRDSVEVLEQKYPMLVRQVRVRADSGGAGTHRGAPGALVEYGPKLNEMTVAYIMDGFARAPRGALGGGEGGLAAAYVVRSDGSAELLNGMHQLTLVPGERLLGHHAGGGGFGSPLERDPDAVLHDCREGYVSLEAAREIYGVVIERAADGSLTLDLAATERLRAGR
jgi:N-methylhydantoinase B